MLVGVRNQIYEQVEEVGTTKEIIGQCVTKWL